MEIENHNRRPKAANRLWFFDFRVSLFFVSETTNCSKLLSKLYVTYGRIKTQNKQFLAQTQLSKSSNRMLIVIDLIRL
jgi:hypothetical protein